MWFLDICISMWFLIFEKDSSMNILNYDPKDKQAYYDYLLSIGFNENGAKETIERLEKNRADREDKNVYKRYKAAEHV